MASHFDNQFKIIAIKNDMQIQPVALSGQYFAVTNSFCGVKLQFIPALFPSKVPNHF